MTRNQRADIRDQFEELREELVADLERRVTQRKTLAPTSAPAADWSDVVTLTHIDHDITQIEAALARIDTGDYGRCELCDDQISFGRLEVMPHTRCCVACSAEQHGKATR
ncbi:MAG: TraR/DksA family transcriptional regulator [Acidimicrobiia bacterium]